MSLQIYNTTVIGSGTQVNLGTTDDAYIGAGGFIGSTDIFGIYGIGSHHSVNVEGSVVANSTAIKLGDDPSLDSGQRITVGENATVMSENSYGISVQSFASIIENNGIIQGYGINSFGNAATGASELVNNGKIHSPNTSIVRSGTEDFHFINNGVVGSESSAAYAGSPSSGDQTLINNGKMSGSILFGSGNDTYGGTNGMIVGGTVHGNDGNDTFSGGRRADYFEGDAGRDILKGGGGADHFIFAAAADSTNAKTGRDLILDFNRAQHDKLDLSTIDAAASSSGSNEAFSFIGSQVFSGGEGELHYKFAGASTFVQGDTDGDRHADFSIELKGHIALHAGDFAF